MSRKFLTGIDLSAVGIVSAVSITGKTTFAASTTSASSFNIVDGVAPTTGLATGDFWATGGNLYYRSSTGPTSQTIAYTTSNITGTSAGLSSSNSFWGQSFTGSGNQTVSGSLTSVGNITGSATNNMVITSATSGNGSLTLNSSGTGGISIVPLGTGTINLNTAASSVANTAGITIQSGSASGTPALNAGTITVDTGTKTTTGTATINLGTGNATNIGIGNASSTTNFLGTVNINSNAILTTASTSSGLTSFGTNATLTTPTIDVINASSVSATTPQLYGNITSGTIGIGTAVGTGSTSGTINIGTGSSSVTSKTINIGTGASAGTTAINIGTSNGGTTTVNGTLVAQTLTTTNISSTTSGNITIKTADSSSLATQGITIQSGTTTSSGANAGTVVIDTGAKSGAGTATLTLGYSNATAINIGNSGSTTTFAGTVSIPTTPVNANDAVNKTYVDNIASGMNAHDAVKYATTGQLGTLSNLVYAGSLTKSYVSGGSSGIGDYIQLSISGGTWTDVTIDGQTVTAGDRILIKNESLAFTGAGINVANGIYTVTTAAAQGTAGTFKFTRATDSDQVPEVSAGDFVYVLGGTNNIGNGFVQTSTIATVGVSAITWSQFSGSSTTLAGNGLTTNTNNPNQIDIYLDTNNTLAINSDKLGLNTVSQTNTGSFAAGTATAGSGATITNHTIDSYGRVTGTTYSQIPWNAIATTTLAQNGAMSGSATVTSARKISGTFGTVTANTNAVITHGFSGLVLAQVFDSGGALVEVDVTTSAGATTFLSSSTALTGYQYLIIG
jgi:hypothetical protein